MIRYIFTGEEERDGDGNFIIPRDATHVSAHESVKIIPRYAFKVEKMWGWMTIMHENIVELTCHAGVLKMEEYALWKCPRLRRVIIRGVKVLENSAFHWCKALEYVECPKLERIGKWAFSRCASLSCINLPSVKIVEQGAFCSCEVMGDANFGKELESLGEAAFIRCHSLERITIPLKNGLFAADDVFQMCENLRSIHLVEAAVLHETVAALLFEEWRNDMNAEIDSINRILPTARAGEYSDDEDHNDLGEKTWVIRVWIKRVLDKIINYKTRHRRLLKAASSTLQRALPHDIVVNNIAPFLELPLHTFDGEDEDEEGEDEYTSEDDNGEEDNDEVDRPVDSHDQLKDDSVPDCREDEEQQQHEEEGGRKRRKTANNDEES